MKGIRFIFHLVKRLLVLTLIVGGCWLYFNNSQARATANQVALNVRQRVANLLNLPVDNNDNSNLNLKNNNSGTKTNSTTEQTSTEDTKSSTTIPTTGRWSSNQATVYINTGNSQLDSATLSAMQAWNQTGAFTFKQTSDKSKADIVVTTMNRSDTNAAGLTKSTTNSVTRRFMHATVYLNTHYLTDPSYGYSQERIVNTAEHELGHAIGLDHTSEVSVMQPAGSFYTIQPADVQAVKQLYNES